MAVSLLSEAKSHWTPVTLEVVPSSPVPKPAQSARWTTCSQECDGNHARMITSDPSWDMYRFLHLFFRMYRSCVSIHRHESSLTVVLRCTSVVQVFQSAELQGVRLCAGSGGSSLCWKQRLKRLKSSGTKAGCQKRGEILCVLVPIVGINTSRSCY